MRALFIGRGPFSATLQYVLREVAPEVAHSVVGKDDAPAAIAKGAFDFAIVVTPPQAHQDLLPAIWTRRKPCWVEKPFGSGAEDAQHLAALWKWFDCPPVYVDFPHNRTVVPPLFPPQVCKMVVGGLGPDRSYMRGLWDWGVHAAAMYLHLGWVTPWKPSDFTTVHVGTRERVVGLVGDGQVSVSTGNAFESKVVTFDHGLPLLDGVPPLQRAMGELVTVAQMGGCPMHHNWSPSFAARVTQLLEGAFGSIRSLRID